MVAVIIKIFAPQHEHNSKILGLDCDCVDMPSSFPLRLACFPFTLWHAPHLDLPYSSAVPSGWIAPGWCFGQGSITWPVSGIPAVDPVCAACPVFTSRFCSLCPGDICFSGPGHSPVSRDTGDSLCSILPRPVISLVGVWRSVADRFLLVSGLDPFSLVCLTASLYLYPPLARLYTMREQPDL